jgi:transcription elongation factor/antiterminator RfaH
LDLESIAPRPSAWLVASTKPQCDNWAAANCAAQGFTTYRPRLLRKQRRPGQPQRFTAAPLFPNYLFVAFTDNWPRLLATYGVTSVLRTGDKPCLVANHLVEQLKAREVNGVVQLPKIQVGQRVHIVRGPFSHQSGLYQGQSAQERVSVLIDVMNRKLRVFVAADAVQVAA